MIVNQPKLPPSPWLFINTKQLLTGYKFHYFLQYGTKILYLSSSLLQDFAIRNNGKIKVDTHTHVLWQLTPHPHDTQFLHYILWQLSRPHDFISHIYIILCFVAALMKGVFLLPSKHIGCFLIQTKIHLDLFILSSGASSPCVCSFSSGNLPGY